MYVFLSRAEKYSYNKPRSLQGEVKKRLSFRKQKVTTIWISLGWCSLRSSVILFVVVANLHMHTESAFHGWKMSCLFTSPAEINIILYICTAGSEDFICHAMCQAFISQSVKNPICCVLESSCWKHLESNSLIFQSLEKGSPWELASHMGLRGCALILSFVTHPFLDFGQIASSVHILDPQRQGSGFQVINLFSSINLIYLRY